MSLESQFSKREFRIKLLSIMNNRLKLDSKNTYKYVFFSLPSKGKLKRR